MHNSNIFLENEINVQCLLYELNWNILDFFRVFYRYDFHLNRSLMGIKLCNSIMQHKNPIIFHWVVQKYVEKLDENCTDKVYVAVESNYYSHANLLDRSFIQKYHTLTWARVNPEVAVLCSASFSHFSGVTCLATKLWVDLISGKGAAFNKEEKKVLVIYL